jgi:hypothetical protein
VRRILGVRQRLAFCAASPAAIEIVPVLRLAPRGDAMARWKTSGTRDTLHVPAGTSPVTTEING